MRRLLTLLHTGPEVEFRTTRIVFLLGATVYPLWSFIYHQLVPGAHDSLEGRAVVGAFCLAGYFLSRIARLERWSYPLQVVVLCGLGLHFIGVMAANHHHLAYVFGLFAVATAIEAALQTWQAGLLFTVVFCFGVHRAFVAEPPPISEIVIVGGLFTTSLIQTVMMYVRATAVRKLRETEGKFRVMADNTPVMIWVGDPEGRTTFVNAAWRRFHDDASRRGSGWWELVHAEDRASCEAKYRRCVLDRASMEHELRMLRRDGTYRWILIRAEPLVDTDGGTIGIVASGVDLTEQREFHEERERTRANMVASASLSSLGEMAAGIAHEINNPLAIISARAQRVEAMLESRPDGALPPEAQTLVQGIIKATDRIAAIIRGLRALSRDASGDPMTSQTLRSVIDDTLAVATEKFKDRDIDLVVGEVPATLELSCRPTQISQVLLNLLNNALDALEGATRKRVRISVFEAKGFVELRVTDSGPGITPLVKRKMFQPFYTTKEAGKGTGLGLSVSRRIAEDHGGTLFVDERAEETTFVLRLPATAD